MPSAAEVPARDTRVAVVDDSPLFRQAAQEVIEATAGFVAVAALCSGEEAVKALGDCETDLVLMDIRLPGMDGVAAAQALRELPRPPVVALLSADEHPDIAENPGAFGATAFVPKHAFGPRALRRLRPPAEHLLLAPG